MKVIYTIFKIFGIRKNILFLLAVLTVISLSLQAQRDVSQSQVREFIVQGKIQEAIVGYAQLVSKEPDKTAVLMEYAYALARGGMFEGALMYLDRARLLDVGNEYYFYAAQTMALMGRESLAVAFMKTGGNVVPAWLQTANLSLPHQSSPVYINKDDDDTAYERANTLAAKGMFLQSLALLQELIDKYPTAYFPYLSISITLENLRLFDKAAESLEKSITLINDTLKIKDDAELRNALPAFNAHLTELKQKSTIQSSSLKKSKFRPQIMLYGGGMYANKYFSFNARCGVFLAQSLSAALDFSLGGGEGSVSSTIGLTAYYRYKFLVGGSGFNLNIAKDNTGCNWRFTGGFSFLNGSGNQSTDIFVSIDIPLRAEAMVTTSISIGQSFYFGKRKSK
jgi:tetratricopeptide (TPR) repeat protein